MMKTTPAPCPFCLVLSTLKTPENVLRLHVSFLPTNGRNAFSHILHPGFSHCYAATPCPCTENAEESSRMLNAKTSVFSVSCCKLDDAIVEGLCLHRLRRPAGQAPPPRRRRERHVCPTWDGWSPGQASPTCVQPERDLPLLDGVVPTDLRPSSFTVILVSQGGLSCAGARTRDQHAPGTPSL